MGCQVCGGDKERSSTGMTLICSVIHRCQALPVAYGMRAATNCLNELTPICRVCDGTVVRQIGEVP